MKQELLGQTIEISESRVQYNKYRKRFTSEAKQAAKRFRADYQNNNRGIVNVIENTPEQIQRAMEPTIDYCIQTLVDHGIFPGAYFRLPPGERILVCALLIDHKRRKDGEI